MAIRIGGTVVQLKIPSSRTAQLKLLTLIAITSFLLSTIFFFSSLKGKWKLQNVRSGGWNWHDNCIREMHHLFSRKETVLRTDLPDHRESKLIALKASWCYGSEVGWPRILHSWRLRLVSYVFTVVLEKSTIGSFVGFQKNPWCYRRSFFTYRLLYFLQMKSWTA